MRHHHTLSSAATLARESIVCARHPASVPAGIRREAHEIEPVSEYETETHGTGEKASEDHAGTYPIGAQMNQGMGLR